MIDKQTDAPQRLNDAPSEFSKESIKAFLEARGMKGIVDSWTVSTILGTLSERTVRNLTNAKKLKHTGTMPYVYTIDNVVEFLIKNPAYVAQRRETWDVTEETATTIKKIVYKSWRGMLQYMDEDDLIAEVQYRMLKTPKTNCSESRAIISILGKIYREEKNKVKTLSLDQLNENGVII